MSTQSPPKPPPQNPTGAVEGAQPCLSTRRMAEPPVRRAKKEQDNTKLIVCTWRGQDDPEPISSNSGNRGPNPAARNSTEGARTRMGARPDSPEVGSSAAPTDASLR